MFVYPVDSVKEVSKLSVECSLQSLETIQLQDSILSCWIFAQVCMSVSGAGRRQSSNQEFIKEISENGLNEHLCNSFLVLLTTQCTLDSNLNTFIYLYMFMYVYTVQNSVPFK